MSPGNNKIETKRKSARKSRGTATARAKTGRKSGTGSRRKTESRAKGKRKSKPDSNFKPQPEKTGFHAFVVMPFGVKEGIDFNKVYEKYIKPALEDAGLEVFRADEEMRPGNIRTDMFQELLIADLVVADLSIDNPNVWYELGVRHALRSRGVIQVQSQRDYLPFDVYVDRAYRYHIKKGAPDKAHLKEDREALTKAARAMIRSWHEQKISPVYSLLQNLEEPEWKNLRVGPAQVFWDRQEAWLDRIDVARRRHRPGQILLLADEAPSRALRLEAKRSVARALQQLGQFKYALEQINQALEIEPGDLKSRQKKGILLGRLGRREEARVWLESVVNDHPEDAESLALLGRVAKQEWIDAWSSEAESEDDRRSRAVEEIEILREAIEHYSNGFQCDPRNFYAGINAVFLNALEMHLLDGETDPQRFEIMSSAIRWTIKSAIKKAECDRGKRQDLYWALVTQGDLEILYGSPESATEAYRRAARLCDRDWFNLDSARQQLKLLRDLGFKPEHVMAGIEVFEQALGKLEAPWKPRNVFLFSGHMVDRDDRPQERFPESKVAHARKEIETRLDSLGAGKEDLALCGGACGGDTLFAEACLARGMRLELRLPLPEPDFVMESVAFAGDEWRDRFFKLKGHDNTTVHIMPEELGPTPDDRSPFARNNLWQLYSALAWGDDRLRVITLWNGMGGDGPGGTQHMVTEARKRTPYVYVINPEDLKNR